MNSVKQHIPNCVSGVEPETGNFSNVDDLMEVSFVKRYMEIPNFVRLSVADHGKVLMAEYKDTFWCLGYFETPVSELPEWRMNDE